MTYRTVETWVPFGRQPSRDGAACARKGGWRVMYPDDRDAAGIQRARAVCARCTVAGDCLTYALANEEGHGVWGGLLPSECETLRSSP